MKLNSDVSRCNGVFEKEGEDIIWREGCEDCLRRTDRSNNPYQSYLMPPEIIVFECEFRIPHS